MEDRREIREGAGLEEARLNQDFIEFLRRWSTPILVVVALGAVGYAGYTRWKEHEHLKIDNAYAEYQRVAGVASPSPESLRRIADEYENIGAVSLMARLEAADVYLQSVRQGIRPGGQIDAQGAIAKPEDALSDQDKSTYLDQAQQLYSQVIDKARRTDAQILMVIGGTYGLAAVAECRGDFDAARKHYETVEALVKDTPYKAHATVAQERIKNLDKLKQVPRLYAKSELPAEAVAPPSPFDPPVNPPQNPPAAPSSTAPAPAPAGPPIDQPGANPPQPAPGDAPPTNPAPDQPAPTEPPKDPPAEPAPGTPK